MNISVRPQIHRLPDVEVDRIGFLRAYCVAVLAPPGFTVARTSTADSVSTQSTDAGSSCGVEAYSAKEPEEGAPPQRMGRGALERNRTTLPDPFWGALAVVVSSAIVFVTSIDTRKQETK